MLLPESIQSLITALERLPGIGPKSASRLAFYLLRASEDVAQDLSVALANLKSTPPFVRNVSTSPKQAANAVRFANCHKRDGSLICVVEEALDVLALERTAAFMANIMSCREFYLPSKALGPMT